MEIKNLRAWRFTRQGALALIFTFFTVMPASAQTAKQVLDKAAAVLSNKNGAQASFTSKGAYLNTSGTLAIKGKKFQITTSEGVVWFDGKTQWFYLKKNDEVNVSNPSESELAAHNPYNIISMYKNGYSSTMEKKGGNYVVHLTAKGKKAFQEMYITINQKTSVPSQIRMKNSKGWTTIDIRNFKQVALADGMFRFNSKEFPSAEVIDLR